MKAIYLLPESGFFSSHNRKYKVIYDGTRFIGVNYDRERVCYVDSCYKNGSSRLEIVGNIYENPELLKERTNDN